MEIVKEQSSRQFQLSHLNGETGFSSETEPMFVTRGIIWFRLFNYRESNLLKVTIRKSLGVLISTPDYQHRYQVDRNQALLVSFELHVYIGTGFYKKPLSLANAIN